jgi:hypothetical protein
MEHGVDELLRLVTEAEPALPTPEVDIRRLAKLDRLQYEKERAEVAKRHKLRKSVLDVSVGVERDRVKKDADEGDASHLPYPEPVEDLAALLDDALAELERYAGYVGYTGYSVEFTRRFGVTWNPANGDGPDW